jgi:hypothetical protein
MAWKAVEDAKCKVGACMYCIYSAIQYMSTYDIVPSTLGACGPISEAVRPVCPRSGARWKMRKVLHVRSMPPPHSRNGPCMSWRLRSSESVTILTGVCLYQYF